jgi:hypothetical protein
MLMVPASKVAANEEEILRRSSVPDRVFVPEMEATSDGVENPIQPDKAQVVPLSKLKTA